VVGIQGWEGQLPDYPFLNEKPHHNKQKQVGGIIPSQIAKGDPDCKKMEGRGTMGVRENPIQKGEKSSGRKMFGNDHRQKRAQNVKSPLDFDCRIKR